MSRKVLRICIDFGGVLSIHDRKTGETGIIQGQHASTTINMEGALKSLQKLKQFQNDSIEKVELYLLSFAGKKRSFETLASVETHHPGLFEKCYFVKDKKYKKLICLHLGANMFIDDTLSTVEDVLDATNLMAVWFKGDPTFPHEEYTHAKIDVLSAEQWDEIVSLVEKSDWSNMPPPMIQKIIPMTKYVYNVADE